MSTKKKKNEDRRVQRTKQLLADALLALMREKGFEALTVQDVIDRANVGRSTFYSHFADKEDLLVSGLDRLRADLKARQQAALLRETGAEERAFAFSRELFAHARDHGDVFRVMVGKKSGAIIQHHFQRMLVDLVRDEMKAIAPRAAQGSVPAEAVVQYVAGGLYGMLAWWIDGKMRLPTDEVDALFRRLAIPALRSILR